VSDTPRTESFNCYDNGCDNPIHAWGAFSAELERELNAANDRIKRLEEDLMDAKNKHAALVADVALYEDRGERIKRLEYGIAKQNTEIEQTCGKVLDYPWYKNDQKNFPSSTEVDGVCVGEHIAETIASELARKYTGLKQRIKRLEEAGDALCAAAAFMGWHMEIEKWNKAKEAKP